MPTALMPDGREVDTASEEWRLECLRRYTAEQPAVDRHVATLLRMGNRQQRAEYATALAERDGQALADRVKAAFLRAWEARQPKARPG